MRITGGHTVQVYRYTNMRNRHGDPELAELPHTLPIVLNEPFLGTIERCILQPTRTASTDSDWSETTELVTIVWAPRAAIIKLENRDRIVVNRQYLPCCRGANAR